MKMNKIILALTIVTLITSCGSDEDEQATKKMGAPSAVEYIVAKYETIENEITIPGTVIPFEMVEIYSEINGRIKKVNFQEGQLVQKGAILIQMDTDILQAQRKQYNVDVELAEKDEKRKRSLLDSKAISAEEYERSQSKLYSLKAQIELLDVQISKGTIRAPFSGKVGLRNVSEGAYVTPATRITSIAQNNKIKIEFSVAEQYAGKVRSGQSIYVHSASDTTSILATVYASEPSVNQSTRMLVVRAQLDAKEGLFPGSFVNVTYNLGKDDQSILVPTSAIVPVLKGQKVWVMKNGTAKSVSVQTGIRTENQIQIIGAIEPGDTIITTGLLGLREGANVTPKRAVK